MKHIKYVEAMVDYRVADIAEPEMPPYVCVDTDPVEPARALLDDLADADVAGMPERGRIVDVIRDLVSALNDAEESAEQANTFSIDFDIPDGLAPLIPVSSIESVDAQCRTAGFLPGEEVAILRLSDLQSLIATAKEHDRCADHDVKSAGGLRIA